MMLFFEIVNWLLLLFSLLYFVIITVFTFGWFTINKNSAVVHTGHKKVSVVVAVRNEAENIEELLNALLHQTYNHELFEIIIVNDHSEDDTVKIIERFSASNPKLNLICLHTKDDGKKEAVSLGIDNAKNNLIITTDGDCIPGKQWISRITGYFEKYTPLILLGPVVYSDKEGLLQKFFDLDFMSLVASGAGSAGAGLPFMGNAANMAFDKRVFDNDNLQKGFASGDDVFLIHAVKKKFGRKSIHFLKDNQALIYTQPPANRKMFFNQRLRWASKAKGYNDAWSLTVSLIVLLFNLGLASLVFAGFFWNWMWAVWLLFTILKTLIDFPLLSGYAEFTGKSKQLIFFWPFEIFYPFYIVTAGIGSLFFKFSWKGRTKLK